MSPSAPKWIPRLQWFFVFSLLFGGYYLLFKEAVTEAQTIFRWTLVVVGVVGSIALRFIERKLKKD
ncbi:MAG TPA: hypothetical protein VF735_10330 [Pyrinomonadaceae bacterium]|jgi:hypothetical protein